MEEARQYSAVTALKLLEVCGTIVDFRTGLIFGITQGPVDEPPQLEIAVDNGLDESNCCEPLQGVVRQIFVRHNPDRPVPLTLCRTSQRRELGTIYLDLRHADSRVEVNVDPVSLLKVLSKVVVDLSDEDKIKSIRQVIRTHPFWRDVSGADEIVVSFRSEDK